MKYHFFDVGANVGQTFDDYLLKTQEYNGWEVWCFEPSPRHLLALSHKMAGLRSRYHLHLCPFGLSGVTEFTRFYLKDDPRGDSFQESVRQDHDQINLTPGYDLTVASCSIADFILSNTSEGDKIILKLDCEGSEYSILKELLKSPAALRRVRQFLVEFHRITHPAGLPDKNELFALYESAGLKIEQWGY